MNVDEQIQALQDADFQTGWAIFNSVRTKRAVSHADLIAARNSIANQLVALERNKQAAIVARKNSERIDEDFELQVELKLAVHALDVAAKQADLFLMGDATTHGLTVPNRQQLLVFETSEKIRVASQLDLERGQAEIHVRRESGMSDVRIREDGETHRRRLLEDDRAMERRIFESHINAEIEISRHRRMTEIEIERRWREIVQDLDAADLIELSEVQLIKKLTGYLVELTRDRYELSQGSDPYEVKRPLLARYDKNIASLEARIDARQARLLLLENGKETLRLEEGNPNRRAFSENAVEAVEE